VSPQAPLIAIVGRPNVGKSTLFNRLAGRWGAIVEDRPGITRDRLCAEMEIYGRSFRLMDTGGLALKPKSALEKKISAQALAGLKTADLILFMMDGREGILPADEEWVRVLRKLKTPKIYLVNKLDDQAREAQAQDCFSLGVSPVIPISAETRRGFTALSEAILATLGPASAADGPGLLPRGETRPFSLAIIGRPNVGKSTLLNAILGEERSIVHDEPGTTRDPINTTVDWDGETYRIIDTAGIRRHAKSTERVEKFSILAAKRMIDESDLALLVLDGAEGPVAQDAVVAGYAFEKQKAIIVVVNKWDEGAKKFKREEFEGRLELKMNYLAYAPVLYVSAKTRKNLGKILTAVRGLRCEYDTTVRTSELNRAFEHIVDHHPLPVFQGKSIRLYYATQGGTRPPTFLIYASDPRHIHFSYTRYVINALRETFGIRHVPIRIIYKAKT
jgi:GTP-binding protein